MPSAKTFNYFQPLLFGISYRMLGSVTDTEAILQEALSRWKRAPQSAEDSPRLYLSSTVMRLCIEHALQVQSQRKKYTGVWLPEPLMAHPDAGQANTVPLAESLTMVFLAVLDSLSPLQRAAYLLREVFVYEFAEIAQVLETSDDECRRLARQAKEYVSAHRARFAAAPEQQTRTAQKFARGFVNGDMPGMMALMSEEVTLWVDDGGKIDAPREPLSGPGYVARYFLNLLPTLPPAFTARVGHANGQPAIVGRVSRRPYNVAVLDVDGDHIRGIRQIINPDKLRHLPADA
jgi:RNA polymerase sigma-70 factor (ECF subfamily)